MPNFKDIYGQKQIVDHFQNALESGKISHAYIINGERSSGKEFIAKIFAMALQCEAEGIEPCNECHACKQALSGNNPDIIEAAKNSYDEYGYGLSSVRFICGTQKLHKDLEEKLLRIFDTLNVTREDAKMISDTLIQAEQWGVTSHGVLRVEHYVRCLQSGGILPNTQFTIEKQFGKEPLASKDYGKIVNNKHFARLCGLIDDKKVVHGGKRDEAACRIEPTVMIDVTFDDAVMGEEIFGPIMPILTYTDFDTVVDDLKGKDKPLALYLFTSDKKQIKRVTRELSYGGGCINDVIIHLATSNMGFGGVGESGMGSYHGKAGFDAFSHKKSIVDKKTWLDLPMRYQPYKSKFYEKLLRIFLR